MLSWAGVYYEKILLCQNRGLDFFFLADSGCFVFAHLFVLGSLQFWELSDRFFIFFFMLLPLVAAG